MPERKKRLFTIVPAIAAMLAASLLVLPIRADLRAALMGVCIGITIVAMVKIAALKRAQRG